jgi:apolipoprotein N-acyltransferase
MISGGFMQRRARLWAGLCGGSTGLLLWLGTPPSPVPWLTWLAFTPLLAWVGLSPAASPRRALGTGALAGVTFALLAFAWLPATLQRFANLGAAPAYALFALHTLWTALPYAVWTLAMARGPRAGLASVAWPAVAWVSLTALWPALFPHTPVAGLTAIPAAIQLAEVGGVALVETQVLVAAALFAKAPCALLRHDRHGALRAVWLGLALVLAVEAAGQLRMASLRRPGPALRVGLVQPNTPLLFGHPAREMERLHQASAAAVRAGADLVVWPEAGAYPFTLRRPLTRDLEGTRRVQLASRVPTIFGANTLDRAGRQFNSAVFLDRSGAVAGLFDKVKLIPGAEYVPFVDGELARARFTHFTQYTAGVAPARFEVAAGLHAGPLVCYEDLFESFARRVAGQPGGVELFVHLAIDSWFGASQAPWGHLAMAQFRAVEHRVPLVRAVAAGPTALIDASGALAATLPLREPAADGETAPEVLVVDVPRGRNTALAPTPYARLGWLYPFACLLASSACAARMRRRMSEATRRLAIES